MKLTENFSLKEFESKDGAEMPSDVLENIKELSVNLQVLRDEIGVPIKINSGYRSPAHNKAIGGVKFSQHTLGKAADLYVKGMEPKELHAVIENLIKNGKMQEGGLGLYTSFVHYDVRNKKARWTY